VLESCKSPRIPEVHHLYAQHGARDIIESRRVESCGHYAREKLVGPVAASRGQAPAPAEDPVGAKRRRGGGMTHQQRGPEPGCKGGDIRE
jgi:hypothetical protein